jgi:hypothetical protein
MENHIKIIGILWIISGALGLTFAFIVFGVLFGVSYIPDVGYEAEVILRSVGAGVGLFLAIISIPEIIGGIWLMKKQEWARILVLLFAFLNLLNFPLGTALGIYSIVILFNPEIIKLFKKG